MSDLDPRTPVLVGVGQTSERIDDADYEALSHVGLAARAAQQALADTGVDPAVVAAVVDVVAATRQFEVSTPLTAVPFGRSTNVPRSIATRVGADPARAIYEVGGGQSPQKLVTELAGDIAAGRADVVLVAGGEAMSTQRHLADADPRPDWSEQPAGSLDDRGYGLRGMVTRRALVHGLHEIAGIYALADNARRAARREHRDHYARSMARLLAPFTEVAAANPHAVAPVAVDADDLVTVDDRNRMITAPYPRLVVSRDLVNQGAAVVLTSVGAAERLGIEPDRWVFLHGHCDLREQEFFDRPDLASAPTQPLAVHAALAQAGLSIDDVDFFDLYSCFPVAVSQLLDGLDLEPDDPRGFTLTGGLPFFGGPGNNYSMHAIAEAVDRARSEPGSIGVVSANGGTLSKVSVGVYSTTPAPWRTGDDDLLQAGLDRRPTVALVDQPDDGWATVETFTVRHGRRGRQGVVVARTVDDRRFVAASVPGDDELVDWLESDAQPVGERVFVRATGPANRVALSRERMDELVPRPPVGWREAYEHLTVSRADGVVEVEVPGDLPAAVHHELADVLDAAEADGDVRVVLLHAPTGLAGQPEHLPRSGWAGLTHRRIVTPVVTALGGDAVGGGFEAVLASPFVVLDDGAGLRLDQVPAGRLPESGGLVRLPRAVPVKVATELALTGRRVPASEALALGLVTRVDPAPLATARALAADLAALPAHAVRSSLAVMHDAAGEPDPLAAVRRPRQAYDDALVGE
ncbi:acetyl-CoA acetyltransferase [Nocardioides sp. C4-1]|uniref:acetyl-CoA acetyltransferase n=1 Tax=Nocardioides sp. C4-1 TaxID=3151851 RepID=UPI003264708C